MSTASHERGLSLRSPGRFVAAAGRLVGLWQRAGPEIRPCADRVADAWIGARAYQLHTLGGSPTGWRRAARWASDPGQPGQGVLVRARRGAARDRAGPAGPAGGGPRRAGRPLAGGLPVRAGRADLRGHQRDPAHGDRRAAARPARGEHRRDERPESPPRRPSGAVRRGPARAAGGADVPGAARAVGRRATWGPGWRCGGGWPGSASPRWPCRRREAGSGRARWTWWWRARNSGTTRCPGRWRSRWPPCPRCWPG